MLPPVLVLTPSWDLGLGLDAAVLLRCRLHGAHRQPELCHLPGNRDRLYLASIVRAAELCCTHWKPWSTSAWSGCCSLVRNQTDSAVITLGLYCSGFSSHLRIAPTCFSHAQNVKTVVDNGVAAVVGVQHKVVGNHCGHCDDHSRNTISQYLIRTPPGFCSKLTISSAKAGSGCIADPLIFTFASELNMKCQV